MLFRSVSQSRYRASSFGKRKPVNSKLNTTDPQYGLCLKTYNSDLFQNWINTEWIEGIQGVNEISAVDVSDGKLSMDALNLSQKVYNMLNRIVVSGGTYRDWLETVYTGSNYFERCETPIFEGGTSQEIVFQEVISNSASGDEPLGTLAGRGVTTSKQKGHGTSNLKLKTIFAQRGINNKLKSTRPQYGLLLKTYNRDLS